MKRTASAGKKSSGNSSSTRRPAARFSLCVDNDSYEVSLERFKVYQVLRDARAEKEGYLRIVDESGEDYLFAATRFILLKLTPKESRSLGSLLAPGA